MVYPLFFGGDYYETVFAIGIVIQQACFFLCILAFVCSHDNRKASALLLMALYGLYIVTVEALFSVTAWFHLLESLLFFTWSIIIMVRYERKTQDYNPTNILLAFYKGDKSTFIMRFFNLFGLDVYSMSIIAGKDALMLKSGEGCFLMMNSKTILKNRDNYYIIDTKKPFTKEFVEDMKKEAGKPATKWKLRIVCIMGIKDLLGKIGDEFKPRSILDNLPCIFAKRFERC